MTPWTAARLASLSIINSQNLLKLMSIESVMPSNHLICHLLLLLPSVFPSIRSYPMNQLFASGGQSIGASVSASVLPMDTQDWFPLGWTGWISLWSKGHSRVSSYTTVQKHQFFCSQGLWAHIPGVFLCAWIALYKDPSHTGLGPSLTRSHHLNYLSKGHLSKSSHILKYWKLQLKHRNFNGGTQIRPLLSVHVSMSYTYLLT